MVTSVIHVFLVFALIVVGPAAAEDRQALDVYFFYSSNCPHCHHQMGLMQAIAANNTKVTVHFHEISKSFALWRTFLEDRSIGYGGVPRTFIGETTFIGYAESGVALTYSSELQGYLGNRVQIVKAIEKELGHQISLGSYGETAKTDGQTGPSDFWPLLLPVLFALSYLPLRRRLTSAERKRLWLGGLIGAAILAIFLLLTVLPEAAVQLGAQRLPYPLFVFTIALADGFNPCAFTVLVILLSLLTYTKNRRDMLLLGTTFIATSAVMY
ncbi:MAG: glutaredoxin family protein, partial [Desulfofustis sp.]|nr:glutaredoxin family protein [Desulfofustis sp.]